MAVSNVTLPSGERVNISHEDDATELDVLNFAFNEYVTNTDPGSAFGRGIRDGVDLLQTSYGSTLEGIGSLLDSESLQQVGADVIAKQRGEMDAEAFRQQRFGDQDQGLIDYTLNLAGTSSPIMGATLAGAGAGFVATGFNPLGAIAGGFLANMPFFYGDNRERQKEAIERGFRTEMDEGAAALYAVPQSLLDAAFSGIGAKFLASGALKAGGGLLTRATRGAVEGAIIEAPTELGQQFLNRYQAGLPTDSDEAKLEYVEAAKGGALLGGLFGGGTRAVFGSKEGADAMPAPATEETVKMPPSVTTPEGEAVSPEVEEILEGEQAPQSELTPEDEVAIDTEIDESLVNRPPPVEQDRMPTVTGQELETQPAPEPLSPDSASAEVAEAVEEMLTAEDEAAIDAEMEREFFGEAVLTADDEAALDAEIRRELSDDTITQEDLPVATSKIIKEFEGMTPKQVEEARFVDEQAKSAPVTAPPQEAAPEPLKSRPLSRAAHRIPYLRQQFEEVDVEDGLLKTGSAKEVGETYDDAYIINEAKNRLMLAEDSLDELANEDDKGPDSTYAFFKKAATQLRNFLNKYDKPQAAPAQEAPKKNIKITAKVLSNLRKTAVQIAGAVGSRTKVELTTFYSKDEDRSVTFDAVNNEGQFDIVDGNEIKGKELPVGTVVDVRVNRYEAGDFELFDSRELRLKEDGTWEKVEDIARLREEAAMPKAEGALTSEELEYILGQMDGDLTVGADSESVEYNLLNSPFIQGYSGRGPQDSSIPNYGSFHYVVNDTQQQALNSAIQSGAVDALADEMVNETTEMMKDPEVSAGMGWYGRMRTRLSQIFGADRDLFTHLLGTTSAQTAVEQNFRYSVNLYNRFKAGEFDPQIKRYLALRGRLQAGTLGDLLIQSKVTNSKGVVYTKELIKKSQPSALLQNAARHFNLLPTQPDGQLFGANSYPALKALSQVWFADRLGKNRMTPKTPQFAMNLNGQSLEATIDVWAARSLRRIIYRGRKEARIVPKEETAVSNPDFALGQLIFARAAKKLNMNPDDLQAVVWFGEKKIWDQNGWTGAAGALKSSFDEPAEVFYPSDGTTRSEADANLILDFLATERLVKRDIAFPTAITPTSQSNNRKKYDEYLRRSIISDFLQSRGRGAVYEGESVESDRRRQVTRAINRLRGFSGEVRYRNGTGKEPTRSLRVIERGSVLSGKQFSAIAKRNQRGNKFGSSVDVLSEAKYKGYDLIVIESGPGANVTLSISPDGEVGSVTKSKKATSLDVAAAFDMAISTGKVKFLNGFETVLPAKYASHGFVPVARLKFDPSQKPPGWSTQTYKKYNNGEPDVIFMRLGGRIGGTYDPTGFPTVDTYAQGINLASQDVTAGTDTGPEIANIINEGKTFENVGQLDRFISKVFTPIARKLGVDIVPNYSIGRALQYNVTQGVIEYNPVGLINNNSQYLTAGMREELIHAAMHKVLINQNRGKSKVAAWTDFMTKLGQDLTQDQRQALSEVYFNLGSDMEFGAEYSRAVIQQSLYGDITEVYAKGKSFEKIKKLFRSIQGFVARTFGSEVSNPEVAGVIRASADLLKAVDPSVRPSNQVVVGAAMNNSVDLNPNSEITSQDVVEAGKPPSKRKIDLNFADKYLFTVSYVLGKIHPRLKGLIRDYYGTIQTKVLAYQTAMAPFFVKMRGIKNKADRQRLKQLLMYSPVVADAGTAEQEALLAKYGMLEDYNNLVRPSLKKLREDLEARGVDIGDLFDYFPRKIKNFKALEKVKAYWGKTVGLSFKSFIDTRNEAILKVRGEMLTLNDELVTASRNNDQAAVQRISRELKEKSDQDDVIITIGSEETALQEAQEWDKFITKFSEDNPNMLPGNARERAIKGQIPDELLQYYEDPAQAMEGYIFNMVSATETIKLIGNRFVTNQQGTKLDQASELGKLVQELRASGAIIDQQADKTIPEIMKLILSPKKGESRILQLARSFGYGTLLVEFTSTLSQLYDLPFVMLDNGLLPTFSAMFSSERLKGSAFGIDTEKISQEFAGDDKFLEKVVRIGLRSTGFTKLDQIMKETNLTANYRRFRKLANLYYKDRNDSRIKTFTAEMTALGYSRAEQDQLIADLKGDKKDSALVRSLLFNKLSETQPLSSAEMAMGIVGNPNLRLAVAMKSFMVKQMVFTKDRMLNDMFGPGRTNAQRLKASKDLATLLTFMLLIGIPTDALKDFLAGRVGYLDDYLFDGTFRVAGVSRYTGYKIRSEGIGRALFDYATPVAFQQAMDATGELQKVMSGERAFTQSKFVAYAPYSDVINRMFGFQKERERKTLKRKATEGESPLFIPPGAL